jgi:hypothetical protein
MEAKEELLESLKRLKEKIAELSEKKDKRNSVCWWNGEECPFCSGMKGFENAGSRCCGCSQLDEERFFSILEDIFQGYDLFEELREEVKEEGKKEAEKEICDDIQKEIEEILEEIK